MKSSPLRLGWKIKFLWLPVLAMNLAALAAAQEAPSHGPAAEPTTPLLAAVPGAPSPEPGWVLSAPKTESVEFRGLASFDQAGVNSGTALFVGGGTGALLAVTAISFALNAAVIDSACESQKTSVQREADKIIQPYAEALADYRSSDLFAKAALRARSAALAPVPSRNFELLARPVFSMTQDQKAIVLDSVVEVRTAQAPAPLFASTIRVVGAPEDQTDLLAYWKHDQGRALRTTAEALLGEALQLALRFADPTPGTPTSPGAKSLRFMQGGTEQVERAEILLQDCTRTVFRTLRGTLMSVPTNRREPACAPPLPVVAATTTAQTTD